MHSVSVSYSPALGFGQACDDRSKGKGVINKSVVEIVDKGIKLENKASEGYFVFTGSPSGTDPWPKIIVG